MLWQHCIKYNTHARLSTGNRKSTTCGHAQSGWITTEVDGRIKTNLISNDDIYEFRLNHVKKHVISYVTITLKHVKEYTIIFPTFLSPFEVV
jgi:hypothetical protein